MEKMQRKTILTPLGEFAAPLNDDETSTKAYKLIKKNQNT